jgi:uncharacterized protein
MLALVSAAVLAATSVSNGAARPGFDCAKATAADERLVCQVRELAVLDRRTAVLLSWRVGMAEDDAHREAERSAQGAWLEQRRACVAGARAPAARAARVACLRAVYRKRVGALAEAVGAVPDALLVMKSHIVSKQGCEAVDVSWPELQATALPGAAAFNAFFAEEPRPPECFAPGDPDADVAEYFRFSSIAWKDDRFVTWRRSTGGHTAGAARPHRGTELLTFDLVEGRLLGPEEVFAPDPSVRAQLVALVQERFRTAGKEAMPRLLAEEVFKHGHWGFTADRAMLHFSPYEIASYADGEFDATFTWAELRPFLQTGVASPRANR